MIKDILLVDDKQWFHKGLAKDPRFCPRRFNVVTADSGGKAVEILRTVAVDAIVIDPGMPDADVSELVGHVKRKIPYVPIIAMTTSDRGRDLRLSSMDVTRHLEGPLDLPDVVEKILTA